LEDECILKVTVKSKCCFHRFSKNAYGIICWPFTLLQYTGAKVAGVISIFLILFDKGM